MTFFGKNQLDEMQQQLLLRIESRGFWLAWAALLMAILVQSAQGMPPTQLHPPGIGRGCSGRVARAAGPKAQHNPTIPFLRGKDKKKGRRHIAHGPFLLIRCASAARR